jgi:hypothetical protein
MPETCPRVYALTVKQPWASLIIHGYKTIENRSWRPPEHLIGKRISIHAGRNFDPAAMAEEKVLNALRRIPHPLPQGSLLGSVIVMGILKPDGSHQSRSSPLNIQGDLAWWIPGYFGWILRDATLLEQPIPMTGKLGLWTPMN